MDTLQAKTSIKNLQAEASSLYHSTLVDLYEIDLSIVAESRGISLPETERYFRFHNQLKLTTTSIFWKGNEYFAAPINATGFQKTSDGTLPTPTISMAVNEAGIPLLAMLKEKIRLFGDLVGCKLTKYRTFSAFLTLNNFDSNNKPNNLQTDEYSEFPPEIWYFNRKTRENKIILEYELNSILDVHGIKLPRRQMIGKFCTFKYRGEGCLYEYNDGRADEETLGETAILPRLAPPIADENDKLIKDSLGISNFRDAGKYQLGLSYNIGDFIYITQEGINFYFVAKVNGILRPPPNSNDWIADKCSKCIRGCRLRWGSDGAVDVANTELKKGELPFGGFFGLERLGGR